MGLLSWIILGVVAGVVTSQMMRRTEVGGYLGNVIVGILGAVAGGFMANLVGRAPVLGFTWISFFVAVLGTAVFLGLWSALRQRE